MSRYQYEAGRKTEDNIALFFNSFNYMVIPLNKGINGQPFDIVARRENDIWFVDAKHVVENKASFAFDRIEANQITSMRYANYVANIHDNMGFIIEWDRTPGKFYYFPYGWYKEMSNKGEKSVKIEKLLDLERIINNNENINKQFNQDNKSK
jgi:hypothetical protein